MVETVAHPGVGGQIAGDDVAGLGPALALHAGAGVDDEMDPQAAVDFLKGVDGHGPVVFGDLEVGGHEAAHGAAVGVEGANG